MTKDREKRGKPKYTVGNERKGFYWQPRGTMRTVSFPEPLGKRQAAAYAKAWRLYDEALEALAGELVRSHAPLTVNWGIDQWRDSDHYAIRADGKPKARKTIKAQEDGLKAISAELGTDDLRALKPKHCTKIYKKFKKSRGLSMAASIMRTMRSLYSFFVLEGHVKRNPAQKLRLHVPGKSYVPWTPDSIDEFYKEAVSQGRASVGLGVALVYDTAQNPTDILTATRRQYDGRSFLLARTKTGVPTAVPLSSENCARLDALDHSGVQIVVSEETGRPYKQRNFNKWVAIIREAAGLPEELKVGNLRHEASQEAQDGGADPRSIQDLLAHASPKTQDHYVKSSRAADAQEARRRYREKREHDKNRGAKILNRD